MNTLPAPLPPDANYAMLGPMDDAGEPASSVKLQHLLGFLLEYWWVPVITLALGLGAGIGLVALMAPTFVSKAQMWQTVQLRLPEGAVFDEDVQSFLGTQTELLKSETLRQLALAQLKNARTNGVVPVG